jgi:nucleoside-diphosphate-sugar epimerase
MTRILVTGASGFVGQALCERLLQSHTVWTLDRSPRTGGRHVVQDLSGPLDVSRLPVAIDAVIHCAAVVGDDSPEALSLESVNVEGTRQILDYASRVGAGEFIFISTGGVYRPSETLLTEDSPVGCPGKYVQSKQQAEALCLAKSSGMKLTVLRPFFPFGPRQRNRLVPRLQQRIFSGAPVVLRGGEDGPRLNPVWLQDLVDAVALTLGRGGRTAETYNVSGREVVTLRELATMIARRLETPVRFEVCDDLPATNWVGSWRKINADLGWEPAVSVDVGIGIALREATPY